MFDCNSVMLGWDRFWNVAGAFVSPIGIRRNRWRPACMTKGVLSRSSGLTGICQYPELQSNVVNTLASPSESIHSSMRVSGYESRMVTAFNRL